MLLQGIALLIMPWAQTMAQFVSLSAILGWGTAMVYPTFLATIAENTNPLDRAKSIGVFRLWRDLGYAIGALLTGLIADLLGTGASVLAVGLLTVLSALIILAQMSCRNEHATKLPRPFKRKTAAHKNASPAKAFQA
jgi:MFS family permease